MTSIKDKWAQNTFSQSKFSHENNKYCILLSNDELMKDIKI